MSRVDPYCFDQPEENPKGKKYVCAFHFDDDYIIRCIKTEGKLGKCTYCNSKRKVLVFEEFFILLMVGVNYLYQDAQECLFYDKEGEHGYAGNTFDAYDIISDDMMDLKIDASELQEDIQESLGTDIVYCSKSEFWDDFEEYISEWNHFKHVVKHKARFVFYFKETFNTHFNSNPISILNNIQENILKLNLIKTITPKTKIYRCTQHHQKDEVKSDGKRIASNPTANCKASNRMSPAGISMFYGSIDKETCIIEAVDFNNTMDLYYTVAYFTPMTNLKLVDLSVLPEIPSIYDKENNHKRDTISFLRSFVEDVSKPIHSTDSVFEYIPTQIITEYIRFNPNLDVDGLIYPSAKNQKIINYVLFMDNSESLEKLKFQFKSVEVFKL